MTQVQNEAYWADNLDPANLGGQSEFERELPFNIPPDWEWATAIIRQNAPSKPASTRPAPLLDLGAGLGVQAVAFADMGWPVVAADIAHSRLLLLQQNVARVRPDARIWPVRCRAEALPFRTASLGAFATRSVLIHTQLTATAPELARTLCPGAPIAIAEPLTSNPFVQLYRQTLAPREWKSITCYFDPDGSEVQLLEKHLGPLEQQRWYFTAFLAFGFQFAIRQAMLWRVSLTLLRLFDSLLALILPRYIHRHAWFVTLRGQRRDP
jgi:ubiquinone/menaquinone biosynthesis C-methylase UbiE